ncbi:hypothetical protein Tco_0708704 [Tanacetum coccineum]
MLHQGMTRCGNPQSVHNLINTATLMPQLFDRNDWPGLKDWRARQEDQEALVSRDEKALGAADVKESGCYFRDATGRTTRRRGPVGLRIKVAERTTDSGCRVSKNSMDPQRSAQLYCTQLADCIDLLFCLATQYRSFVQKNRHKENDTRLSQMQTPTPVTDTHTTTSVTNAQIQAMINEGVTADWQSCLQPKMVMITYTLGTGARMAQCMLPPVNVKGTDVVTYSQRFQELALMCDRMFQEEIDKDAIEFATKLMDKKINTWAERQATTKESLMTPPGTTRISNLSKTETKTLEELYCHWKW